MFGLASRTTLNFPLCYFLVFHGSSDPRSQAAAEALTAEFSQKVVYSCQIPQALGATLKQVALEAPLASCTASLATAIHADAEQPVVQAVYLECQPLPLHQQIATQLQKLQLPPHVAPIRCVILPVFLLQGVHVMEDIPAELSLVQSLLGTSVQMTLTPHLGSHPGLCRIISEQMATVPAEVWVLLAHGSRRPGANHPLESLAEALGAVVAYWSMPPDLESCLTDLVSQGFTQIGIAPFFLFPGAITDAIAATIHQFSLHTPAVKLTLIQPLNACPELTDLLLDLIHK
jgi:sirohydrochlorin ferrochelatase